MIKAERQDRVKQLLASQGSVSVKQIADQLGVSDMTVRRDLEELSQLGELVRVHGGAMSTPAHKGAMLSREYSHAEKRSLHAAEKLEAARTAASLIRDGSTVFLGTGTTIEQMVPLLPACRLRIITNSLSVFNLLEGREDYDLCLIGGLYRGSTAAFVGPIAEEAIENLGVDTAFIGANGVMDGSVSTSNMEEGRVQQLAYGRADERYLVADSSKVGRRDFYTFYRLEDLDGMVCEPGIDAGARAEVEQYGKGTC